MGPGGLRFFFQSPRADSSLPEFYLDRGCCARILRKIRKCVREGGNREFREVVCEGREALAVGGIILQRCFGLPLTPEWAECQGEEQGSKAEHSARVPDPR